jgi:hypothetical protein
MQCSLIYNKKNTRLFIVPLCKTEIGYLVSYIPFVIDKYDFEIDLKLYVEDALSISKNILLNLNDIEMIPQKIKELGFLGWENISKNSFQVNIISSNDKYQLIPNKSKKSGNGTEFLYDLKIEVDKAIDSSEFILLIKKAFNLCKHY